jgi:hypothetical protein
MWQNLFRGRNRVQYKLQLLSLIISMYIILRYSLDFKIIYPEWLIELYDEPMFRMILLFMVYFIANINVTYSILYFIFLIFLEYDHRFFFR